MTESQIILEKFDSESLKNNPLGDPSLRRVPVYLPSGYDEDDKRYPVVYLLVGFAGRGRKLLNDALWNENIQERMDRLIAACQTSLPHSRLRNDQQPRAAPPGG